MKNPIPYLLILTTLALPGYAAAYTGEDQEDPAYCSAETIDRDGNYNPMVRVECDSSLAGQCAQETKDEKGEYRWEAVAAEFCDLARK